jgi:hypothetical protein
MEQCFAVPARQETVHAPPLCASQYGHIPGFEQASAKFIECFRICYVFMRVCARSHAVMTLLKSGCRAYIAVQEVRTLERGRLTFENIRSDHMTAATFHTPTALPQARSERKPGFFARLFDAMAEARMQAAMRELRMHRHLIPEDVLKKAGYAATLSDDGAYPFTR